MHALPNALDALVHRGQAERTDVRESFEYVLEVAEYCALGYVTDAQARALCQMLGFGRGEFDAALASIRASVN